MGDKKKGWDTDNFVNHWKYYTPPARASPSDLEFIKKKIKQKGRKAKILILGSTPEYRDLCGNMGIPITLLDFNRLNYKYLAREITNLPKETFIQGNWLNTVLNEKFDIILADNVPNMLSEKKVHILFGNVSKMLKKNGLFMPRTYIFKVGESRDPVKVIRNYRAKRHVYGFGTGTMRIGVLGSGKYESGFKEWYGVIKKLYKKKLITRQERDFCGKKLGWNVFKRFGFYMPYIKDFEKICRKYFRIADVFNATEPYMNKEVPLYVLVRK